MGFMNFPSREEVENIRKRYPVGARIELVHLNDPYSKLQPGEKGVVRHVDDAGTVHCNWDCGSTLGIVLGEDSIMKLT